MIGKACFCSRLVCYAEAGRAVAGSVMVLEIGDSMEAYLDNAATTAVFPEVIEITEKVMKEDYGNPSSKHTKGLEAERYIRGAREKIAGTLKCQPKEIFFTSGGTEANNFALLGTAFANQRSGKHIITTRIEHASVLEPLAYLEELGWEVTYLPVDALGRVSVEEAAKAIREDTVLVSVMYVNNEVGSIQPVAELGGMLKRTRPDILFHVDGIQAYGKMKIKPGSLKVDLLSASGHKIHGPKGVGFLYVRDKVKIRPLLFGGGQQGGMRSGTENVQGIAGLGAAVEKIYEKHSEKTERLYQLKKQMLQGLNSLEGVTVNGVGEEAFQAGDRGSEILKETAPHIVSASFAGVRSEVMLHALAERGIYVSSGSACSSNRPELSGTLKAIGVKDELLDSTLRFSFSVLTTSEQVEYTLKVIGELLPTLRRFIRK